VACLYSLIYFEDKSLVMPLGPSWLAGPSCGIAGGFLGGLLHSAQPMNPASPFLKMLATTATFFSGIPGGIFVPACAAGAGFGVDLANRLPIAPASAMILLTMTAYFFRHAAIADHLICDRHGNDQQP